MTSCTHNVMTERVGDPVYAWQCADCGYVYGRDGETTRTFQSYRLPDGTVVPVDASAAKGAPTIGFTLKGGEVVTATRVGRSH